jgi:hydrogenase small subunit
MNLTRRDFMRYLVASAAALGYSQLDLSRVAEALAAKPPLVWLQGASCNGCSVSLLNSAVPVIDDVLLNTLDLRYHPTLMAAAGDQAVTTATQNLTGGFPILVVEGAIPTAHDRYGSVWETVDGRAVSIREAVQTFAPKAQYIMAVGSCASFGGIPGRSTDTGVTSVTGVLPGRTVINVPGCPAHPDRIIGTITDLLLYRIPTLDRYNRPTKFFGRCVHQDCPFREREEANTFGQEGRCLEELGCQGPRSWADCVVRRWNNGVNWCANAGGLCIGCTEPSFPAFPFHSSGGD